MFRVPALVKSMRVGLFVAMVAADFRCLTSVLHLTLTSPAFWNVTKSMWRKPKVGLKWHANDEMGTIKA